MPVSIFGLFPNVLLCLSGEDNDEYVDTLAMVFVLGQVYTNTPYFYSHQTLPSS